MTHRSPIASLFLLCFVPLCLLLAAGAWAGDGPGDAIGHGSGKVIARGAESYGPVTPIQTVPMSSLAKKETWVPGDPIKDVPRRVYPAPGVNLGPFGEGLPDPLLDVQAGRALGGGPTIDVGLNIDAQAFTGATPPDTVGDVGPDHYVHAVNASQIAIFDKDGNLLPGYPISLDSLAPSGACTSGFGDPIVLYDWLADRWFLQEFTGGGDLCLYISTTADPTGAYNFYQFTPPSFPDYPHYGVWSDAYYAGTNEGGGSVTTYAFDRVSMLAGDPATMQRLTVVPAVSGYGFQLVTPADHDGDLAPPANEPGIFMRHIDDEAHSGSPDPADDFLEIYEMDVDFATPANTTVTALPAITITDFNSWFVNYSTFFSVPQPSSGTRLDPIREAILQRLVYRNFGSHEVLLGVFPTNRDPATSGSNVEAANRWFELRRSGGGAWSLFQEGTFGGDTNSATANFFVGSVAMDGAGNIAMGYSKTDVGASPVFPSIGFAGRLETDPAGVMGSENDAVLGVQSQSGTGRWGDYANLSVDPEDDCTFWFTTEYMPGGSWGTRLTSWTFQECLFGFILTPTPAVLNVCAPTDPDPTVDVEVTSVGGWSDTVTLAASGEPAGTSSTFVPNGQTVDYTSTYSLLDTDSAATGSYSILIEGLGGDVDATERSTQVILNLAAANPGTPSLTSPSGGETGVGLLPTFSWAAASDAASYDLEVATDPAFTDVVLSASGLSATTYDVNDGLEPNETYYWRVTASNLCDDAVSPTSSFSTVQIDCATYVSSNVPLLIPEGGGTSGTTVSTLSVPDAGTIVDVNVIGLVGTHTFMGDLDFNLESPATTSVEVIERNCGTAEDFDASLDDEAADPLPCPPIGGGTYQPSNPLSAFQGEDTLGTWILTINDNAAQDSGQLDGWGLELCVESTGAIFSDGFESGDTSSWSATVQ